MRGIVLAGNPPAPAEVPRLRQWQPLCGKPLIHYSLSILLLAGIRHILLISTPQDTPHFQRILGGGDQWGIALHYAIQHPAEGSARAFLIASEFLGGQSAALVSADSVLYGENLPAVLENAATTLKKGARIFAHRADHHESRHPPDSPFPCFYDHTVVARAREIESRGRGGLNLADLNQIYRDEGALKVAILPDDITRLDTSTQAARSQAAEHIAAIEKSRGVKINCLEEIAWRAGYIDDQQLHRLAAAASDTGQSDYLRRLPQTASAVR